MTRRVLCDNGFDDQPLFLTHMHDADLGDHESSTKVVWVEALGSCRENFKQESQERSLKDKAQPALMVVRRPAT